MKIGLRAGHSDNCEGAVGIVNEHDQMKLYYAAVKAAFEANGHIIIDCNSNGSNANAELSEGANIANSNNVDLFVSLHMNASDGQGHGVEAWVSSTSSKAYNYADNLCTNFSVLGFTNRCVKTSTNLYEMNHVAAPNIIFEICFCDSQTDIDIYNKYSWDQLAYAFCSAIDPNIPRDVLRVKEVQADRGYIVTTYLPKAYPDYDGVNINSMLTYFKGIECYIRSNNKGIWIETEWLDMNKCEELKQILGSLFYSIETK